MTVSNHQSSSGSNEITQETQDSNVDQQVHSELNSSQMAATSLQDQDKSMVTASGRNHQKTDSLIKLVRQDLKFIGEASGKIKKFDVQVDNKLNDARNKLQKLESLWETDDLKDGEVLQFRNRVTKFKLQIPFKIKISDEQGGHRDTRLDDSSRGKRNHHQNEELSRIVTILFADDKLTSASKDFLQMFDGLAINLKLCLLCFAVFPENVIIRKRLMIYWWLGEGFLTPSPEDEKTAEEHGDELFDELIQKDFITSAHKKRTLAVNSCKMHPFVRSAVILLARKANFFDFDSEAIPKDDFSSSLRLCLVGDDYSSSSRSCLVGDGLVNAENLAKVHTLFNLNEDILDFKLELFSKMTNVNVVYLGRWQATAKHHVEIDDPKILESFKVMKHLKFLSLQGISRITKLPGSISMLHSLTILDLRACHSLEAIPEEIGSLESLMHLDMSECYLLNSMPKELSLLKSLLVLKGFVVGAGPGDKTLCTLEDLAKLPELRKLGIYTNREDFPGDHDLLAFSKFDKLTKLGITWGSNQAKSAEKKKEINTATEGQGTSAMNKKMSKLPRSNAMKRPKAPGVRSLPTQLKKLDLRCFPGNYAPNWLNPDNLPSLEKLYIRGGKICVLSQCQEWKNEEIQQGAKWKVEALRLKYLSELRMDWKQVQNMFPKLVYLEKLRCPKLTLFPCDVFGIWIDNTSKAWTKDNTKSQSNYNKWHPEFALAGQPYINNSLIASSN